MNSNRFDSEYRRLFLPLTMFATRYLGDAEEARDLVNSVFERVWRRICDGDTPENLKSYLYTAVRNSALNQSDTNRNAPVTDNTLMTDAEDCVTDDEIDTSERDARLWRAIEELPERCRKTFLLAKRDGLSYAEISEEMGISVKTVENQITKALAKLRKAYGLDKPSGHSAMTILLPFL